MSVTYYQIEGALNNVLNTFAATYATMPVAWDEIGFTEPNPEDNIPWIRPHFFPDDNEPAAIGLSLMKKTGRYQIDIFWPHSINGSAAAVTCADSVLSTTYFGTGVTMTAGSRKIEIKRAFREDGRNDEGGWYHIPVKIEWECYAANG